MTKTSIQLLRGADTIGGTCVRIMHGDDSILLDYGKPLMASGGHEISSEAVNAPTLDNGILLDVLGDGQPPLAMLISHAHPDHYGLIDFAINDMPVYMNLLSKELIKVGNIFYAESMRVAHIDDVKTFEVSKSFTIGPFNIVAFPMDHSAFGACSLLISVGGKRIFYTGDFRGHGRCSGGLTPEMIANLNDCDVMLMEGTTLGEGHPDVYPSEKAVENAVVDLCKLDSAPIMVAGSGSNVDRFLSLYDAAKRTGREIVIDLYQLYLLEQLAKYDPRIPPLEGDHLRVYYPQKQAQTIVKFVGKAWLYKYQKRQIRLDDIDTENGRYIFRLSNLYSKHISGLYMKSEIQPQLVYSMWKGYMAQQDSFANIAEMVGGDWEYVHTSGHAYLSYLKELAAAIAPKNLIPMHTLYGDSFPSHFANVRVVANDGVFAL